MSITGHTLRSVQRLIAPLTVRLLGKRTRRAMRFDLVRLRARVKHPGQARPPSVRQLHVGCGRRKVEGFLNVDVADSDYDVDLGGGLLPWPDASFDSIVSQQVIEHLELDSELRPLLGEMGRVLSDGGELWLACPDMEAVCRSYLADGGRALLEDRKSRWPTFSLGLTPTQQMVNVLFHQAGEHVNLFDFPLLKWLLEESGFKSVERMRENDLRERFPQFPLRADDEFSLYVRAKKGGHS